MKPFYTVILLFVITIVFAQETIGEQMWSDTSRFKMMPDTSIVMMTKGHKLKYNRHLYLSSVDQQLILELYKGNISSPYRVLKLRFNVKNT